MHASENLSFLNDTVAHRVRVKPVVSKTSPRRRAVSSSSITVSVVASLLGDSAAPSCIHQEGSLRFRFLTPRALIHHHVSYRELLQRELRGCRRLFPRRSLLRQRACCAASWTIVVAYDGHACRPV